MVQATRLQIPKLMFALFVAVATQLPVWVHVNPTSPSIWFWPILSMSASLMVGNTRSWCCVALISLGMCIDFAMIPALAMLNICKNSVSIQLLLTHLYFFPVTNCVMFGLLLVRHVFKMSAYKILLRDSSLMLFMMPLSMEFFRLGANFVHLNWSAGGMVSAMLCSMFVIWPKCNSD